MVKRYIWNGCAVALLACTVALADSREPSESTPSSTPSEAACSIDAASFLNNLVGMELLDQHGLVFQPDSLVNHVVLFNFIFTNCGSVCPLQTRTLAQVYRELPDAARKHVRFVSLSIDPVKDTPDKLRQFSKNMDADLEGWSFLTGDPRQIERLAERLQLFDPSESAPNKTEMHRTSLWLADKQGRMLQRYRGDPPDKERLIRELTQVSSMTVH